jgi:hypothetical protein
VKCKFCQNEAEFIVVWYSVTNDSLCFQGNVLMFNCVGESLCNVFALIFFFLQESLLYFILYGSCFIFVNLALILVLRVRNLSTNEMRCKELKEPLKWEGILMHYIATLTFNKFQTTNPLTCLKYKEIRQYFILTVSVFVECLWNVRRTTDLVMDTSEIQHVEHKVGWLSVNALDLHMWSAV